MDMEQDEAFFPPVSYLSEGRATQNIGSVYLVDGVNRMWIIVPLSCHANESQSKAQRADVSRRSLNHCYITQFVLSVLENKTHRSIH